MNLFLRKYNFFLIAGITLFICIIPSCEREAFRSGQSGDFQLSTDTIMFDTIFTDFGTPTHKLLIKNPNSFKLEIDSVYLKSNTGIFVLNINGETLAPEKRLSIDANDSLYIFIQAFIPSGGENAPFLNEDAITFVSGSTSKKVMLIAFGQNVILFRNEIINSQTWNNHKPYLIYETLTVDSASKLTLLEGTRVFFHRNAKLVVKGTLNVSGSFQNPVRFTGDRREKDYDTIPGQWGGLVITGTSEEHLINYAVIRNATTGITFGDPKNSKIVQAEMNNTFIANMGYAALIAYESNLLVNNSVFANTANTTCALYGGKYSFRHCTFANFGARYVPRSVISRTVLLQNYLDDTGSGHTVKNLTDASFSNSIIYGNSYNELLLVQKPEGIFNYKFENCLVKTDNQSLQGFSNILDKSPRFIKPENENFRIDSLSAAKNAGNINFSNDIPQDLDNQPRNTDSAPDMGAYERNEKP